MLYLLPLLVVTALLLPSSVDAQSPPVQSNTRDVVLNPGDVIRITVWRKPELSGEFLVAADGTIAEPFYMDVTVGGISFVEASRRVRSHVEQIEIGPRVLVEPLFRIAVGGEVRQPSVYSVSPETTVFQAVILAGGPNQLGERNHIRLFRGQQELALSLPMAHMEHVRSGDRIFVDRRTSVFREVVVPTVTIIGALASIVRVFLRF